MKNIITLIVLILISSILIQDMTAQTNNLEVQINNLRDTVNTLQNNNFRLRKDLNQLKRQYSKKINNIQKNIDKHYSIIQNLEETISLNSTNIGKTTNELGEKIDKNSKETNQSITDLNKTVSQNTLYWIIAILVVVLLVLLVFILLRKQIFKQKTDLDSSLQDTRKVLEEEGVKLDNKLIEVLEKQLKIISNSNTDSGKETDHTLALKVADEIIRIQKNLTRMDEKTKGLKQLTASVKRIQDNFASNGYELVEMLGKPFNDGMKVTANFIPDEDLEAGQQIITRIIKPQVNYKGVMIQSAQIEVSQGE